MAFIVKNTFKLKYFFLQHHSYTNIHNMHVSIYILVGSEISGTPLCRITFQAMSSNYTVIQLKCVVLNCFQIVESNLF